MPHIVNDTKVAATFGIMGILQAINRAVVGLFHLFFDPLHDGETATTVEGAPFWVRAAIGWALIAVFLGAFIWLR